MDEIDGNCCFSRGCGYNNIHENVDTIMFIQKNKEAEAFFADDVILGRVVARRYPTNLKEECQKQKKIFLFKHAKNC